MKKRLYRPAAIVLSAILLAGCGTGTTTDTVNTAAETDEAGENTTAYVESQTEEAHSEISGQWICTAIDAGNGEYDSEPAWLQGAALDETYMLTVYDNGKAMFTVDYDSIEYALPAEETETDESGLEGEDAADEADQVTESETAESESETEAESSEDETESEADAEDGDKAKKPAESSGLKGEDSEGEASDEEDYDEEDEEDNLSDRYIEEDEIDKTSEQAITAAEDEAHDYLMIVENGNGFAAYTLDDYDFSAALETEEAEEDADEDEEDEDSTPVYAALTMSEDGLIMTVDRYIYSEEEDEELQVTLRFKFENAGEAPESFLEFSADFDEAQTAAMSNFMNYNMYISLEQGVIYGRTFSEGSEYLSRIEYTEDEEGNYELTRIHHLERYDEPASYFCTDGELIYFCAEDAIWSLDPSDDQIKKVRTGGATYLQYAEGRLFFSPTDTYEFHCILPDGSDEQVVLEQEAYYPYLLGNGWLMYEDARDKDSIHVCKLATGFDTTIMTGPVYNPVFAGNTLYAVSRLDASWKAFSICRINLNDYQYEISDETLKSFNFFIDGENLYLKDGQYAKGLDQWNKIYKNEKNVKSELRVYRGEGFYICCALNTLNQYTTVHVYHTDPELEGFDLVQ